jgi:Bacterial Ig-like domain (group 2)
MSSRTSKLRLIGAFAALATLALAISCTGFFVNPTLTGVSVGPQSLTLNIPQTFQMSATGTFSDGSQKALTSGVVWASSDASTVSVGQTSGIVTAVQTGSATITASSGSCSACSGSTTVTVALTGVTAIIVSPSNASATQNGSPAQFQANAQPSNVDITGTGAVWKVQDSSGTDQSTNFTLSFDGTFEDITPLSGATAPSYTVVATYPGTTATGTATLNVTP